MILRKQNLTVQQFFVIYMASLVGLGLLFLGLSGRLNPLFALLGAALPIIARMIPWIFRTLHLAGMYKMLRGLFGGGGLSTGASAQQTSEISSRFIHMTLNHETGVMDGTVLEGSFEDAILSELKLEQLLGLLRECQVDADSNNLLMAYLDRVHTGWQSSESNRGESHATSASDTDMSEAQALDILGLDDDATPEEIVSAHRRLMQKMHPDHGGSNYLAAKINTAKDLLVEVRGKPG